MPANDDMLDVEMGHGVLDHGHDVQICVGDHVGYVAVYEHLSGIESHDLVGWDTAIAAADISAFSINCFSLCYRHGLKKGSVTYK